MFAHTGKCPDPDLSPLSLMQKEGFRMRLMAIASPHFLKKRKETENMEREKEKRARKQAKKTEESREEAR